MTRGARIAKRWFRGSVVGVVAGALLGNVAPAEAQARRCLADGASGRGSVSAHSNDDVQTYKWTIGGCRVTVRMEGAVVMTPDFTGFGSIARGGEVRIEDNDGRVERRLEVRTGSAGSLEYAYRVGRRDMAYDGAAAEWLSGLLLDLYRVTGFAAKERAAWILGRQGPDGVLAEISQMRGDYAKRRYFEAILASGRLEPPVLRRVLTLAGETLGSDYELAELLIATGKRYVFDEATRDAYLGAQRSIESDYERRRVLNGVITGAALTPAQTGMVLEAAATIESDYELAELLIQMTGQDLSSPEARARFLSAVASIESDYEHRRVLSALLKRERLTREQLGLVLASAHTIGSDYELAELLLQVLAQGPLDGAMHESFLAAMDTLGSSHEYGRVATALLKSDRAGR